MMKTTLYTSLPHYLLAHIILNFHGYALCMCHTVAAGSSPAGVIGVATYCRVNLYYYLHLQSNSSVLDRNHVMLTDQRHQNLK